MVVDIWHCAFENWSMSYTVSSIMRLNKEDLVRMLIDYQGKPNNSLDELKNHVNKLKTELWKFESDLHISRNVNDKLSDKLVVLERKCHANEQYSKKECLEILGITAEVRDNDLKQKCWRFWIQSTPLLTLIWLRTTIVYPQTSYPKK